MMRTMCQDLKRNFSSFLLIQIQVIVAMVLIVYTLTLLMDGSITIHKMKQLSQSETLCKLSEELEENEIDELTDEKEAELKTFQDYMAHVKGIRCIVAANTQSFYLDMEKTEGNVTSVKRSFFEVRNNTALANMVMVNENFFEFYDIAGSYTLRSRKTEKGVLQAVILGNDFRNAFSEGDILYDPYGTQYVVTGFLPKGAYYINPYERNEPFYLDNYFVTNIESSEDSGIASLFNIESATLVVDDYAALEKLLEKAEALGLDFFYVQNFTDEVAESIQDILNAIMTMGTVSMIIMLFASIGFVAMLLRFIEESMEEFAVEMVCGATKMDVMKRVVSLVTVIIMIGLLVVSVIFHFRKEVAIAAALAVIYGGIVLILPVRILYRLQITEILRRKE